MSDILEGLSPVQSDAVVNFRGPSLIVAGAGSGKTRVLTRRIAYMLEQGVAPYKILSLTFTNKAAAEMRERVSGLVSEAKGRYLWLGTFHSVFSRILRAEADKLGYPESFTIYDTSDGRNVIKGIIKDMSLSDDVYKPQAILSRISLAKNNLVTADAYRANTMLVAADRENRMPYLTDIYAEYVRRCRANGAMDFDDLLLNMNILFRDFPDVLEKYQNRFEYLLVDEYQDTNYAQYLIVRKLAEKHKNVCVVGDDAQSIYSFRGAKIENILRFQNDFQGAQVFKLEQNYRSTRTIVEAANCIIEKNKKQLKKESYSEGDRGDSIKVLKAYTDQEEAAQVADSIRDTVRSSGADWCDVAVLYRTNMQSRVMEESLRRRNIPYKIWGGTSFYQRKEVKDLLGYIRLVVNPRDDEAFLRVVNYPARGLGDVTIGRLQAAAKEKGMSLWEALHTINLAEAGVTNAAVKKLAAFVEVIEQLSLDRQHMGLYQIGLEIATRSGIIGIYKMDGSPESQSALDNIEELLNSMQTFSEQEHYRSEFDEVTGEELSTVAIEPTLEVWVQNVALLTDMDNEKDENRNKVTLMTVHAAKGLEFRYVFIVGLEENLFPSMMSMNSPDSIEEERRLFYVAVTRAKEAVTLSFAESRFKWGSTEFCRPSRFLSEIDPKYLDMSFDLEDTRMVEDRPAAVRTFQPRDGAERGRAADKWRSPKPYERALNDNKPSHGGVATVNVPRPDTSGMMSIGRRDVTSGGVSQQGVPVGVGGYSEGMRVSHAKFGTGTVVRVEQFGGDEKITVDFAGAGQKTLLGKFAKLNVVE